MEILKYLDVLIGLAVVMVLLSPLVSAITQLWLWLWNSRPKNLRKGLERILRQLEPDPYELFEAVEITGLAAGSVITLQQPKAAPPVIADGALLTQNIAAMLRETNGNLLAPVTRAGKSVPALQVVPAVPPAAIRLWVRGERNSRAHPVSPQPVSLLPEDVKSIAESVLLHNMVEQSKFLKMGRQQGEVIEREELIRILLEFAAKPADAAQAKLKQILAADGVPDPGQAIADIRTVAQQLELISPQDAAHDRLTKAILTAAQSAFVGKINNWFDQTMARISSEYKFRAQLMTIAGALVVATCVQLDSIDLLRRLSTDDKLRSALVTEAKAQQDSLVAAQAAAHHDENEIQLAKARRDEIETSLAKMRDPQLGLLPEHFIWQPLPRARLALKKWAVPYSKRFELALGTSLYPIEPVWSGDLLGSIADAIHNSDAPVSLAFESHHYVTVSGTSNGTDVSKLRLLVEDADALTHLSRIPSIQVDPAKVPHQQLTLIVGYAAPAVIDNTAGDLQAKIEKSSAPVSTDGFPTLTALDPEVPWIQLRDTHKIYFSSIATKDTARMDDLLFGEPGSTGNCRLLLGVKEIATTRPCSFDSIIADIQKTSFTVKEDAEDHLVLTSHRLGIIQLRATPGNPDSNILNRHIESTHLPFQIGPLTSWLAFDADLFASSWRGILLTWVLLSLGAPFWYDALKDLLKLRSNLAKDEEDARKDRQTKSA